MRFTTPTVILMMAAVLLTGCAIPAQGPDQAERDSWSRVIETAIQALPGVVDASHWFDYEGKSRTYASRLDVQLEDDATPDEAASVVRAMGAQQLPPRYQGDQTEVDLDRMTDSYSANWRFGRDVSREANSAHTWVRVSAPGTQVHWSSRGIDVDQMSNAIGVRAGSEAEPHRATAAMRRIIQDFPELAPNDWTVATVPVQSGSKNRSRLEPGWLNTDRRPLFPSSRPRFPSNSELELWEWFLTDQPTPFFVEISVYDPPGKAGRTLDVAIYPPVGKQLTAAQATQLAEKHLPYLAQPGAVVDYTIETRNGPVLAVFIGGCQPSWRDVSPESQPYARQYERC
ncbi:hypothetical protein [Nocardia abscessus]|uniref:hypothetical protein n=1 Tax=Nocardia abscessus TaxID=120957 RepID=UPI0002F34337|nr:hypothetical protein [Nocardia abscessus]MCC3333010.1 hypothetical protein [Nocardia abscessus]